MLEEIKEMLKSNENITCYKIALALNKNPRDLNVAKNYWKAKYELLMEQVQKEKPLQDITPLEDTAPVEPCYQEGVPDQWTDSEGAFYVKGTKSGTWRVYPNGLEFGCYKDIEEHKVKARYAVEALKK